MKTNREKILFLVKAMLVFVIGIILINMHNPFLVGIGMIIVGPFLVLGIFTLASLIWLAICHVLAG